MHCRDCHDVQRRLQLLKQGMRWGRMVPKTARAIGFAGILTAASSICGRTSVDSRKRKSLDLSRLLNFVLFRLEILMVPEVGFT